MMRIGRTWASYSAEARAGPVVVGAVLVDGGVLVDPALDPVVLLDQEVPRPALLLKTYLPKSRPRELPLQLGLPLLRLMLHLLLFRPDPLLQPRRRPSSVRRLSRLARIRTAAS